jgi:hypothetical protein
MHGIEYEVEVYWSTSRYIADAKLLGVYLTKDEIAQIRANYLRLGGSRHATVRRGAMSLSARLSPNVPRSAPEDAPTRR